MINVKIKEGITETLEILNHIDKMYTTKLPRKFLEFLNENKSETYIPKIDFSKKLTDLNLKEETKNLLGIMYLNYWSTPEEKREFVQLLNENELKYQKEIAEKYNTDNLFKKKHKTINIEKESITEDLSLMPIKESILKKIWNKILNIINYKK